MFEAYEEGQTYVVKEDFKPITSDDVWKKNAVAVLTDLIPEYETNLCAIRLELNKNTFDYFYSGEIERYFTRLD